MSDVVTTEKPTDEVVVAPVPETPKVTAQAGKQRVGWFVDLLVEGETLWRSWHAKEPTADELAALADSAKAALLEHGTIGHMTAGDLGLAPKVDEPAPPPVVDPPVETKRWSSVPPPITPPEPVSTFHAPEPVAPEPSPSATGG